MRISQILQNVHRARARKEVERQVQPLWKSNELKRFRMLQDQFRWRLSGDRLVLDVFVRTWDSFGVWWLDWTDRCCLSRTPTHQINVSCAKGQRSTWSRSSGSAWNWWNRWWLVMVKFCWRVSAYNVCHFVIGVITFGEAPWKLQDWKCFSSPGKCIRSTHFV